jgi:hypothetical protein
MLTTHFHKQPRDKSDTLTTSVLLAYYDLSLGYLWKCVANVSELSLGDLWKSVVNVCDLSLGYLWKCVHK